MHLLKGQSYWDQLTQRLGIPQSCHQPRPLPRKPSFLDEVNDGAEWMDSVPNVRPPPPTLPPSLAEMSSLTLFSSTVDELSPWKQVAKDDQEASTSHSPHQDLAQHWEAATQPEENQQSKNPHFSHLARKPVASSAHVHPRSQTGLSLCPHPASGNSSFHSQSMLSLFVSWTNLSGL